MTQRTLRNLLAMVLASFVASLAVARQDAPPSDPAVVEAERRLAERPGSPERVYNLGVALYRAGDRDRAAERFREAATLARSADLAARAMYNEGVAAYATAVETLGTAEAPTDLEGAIERVETAFTHFRDAAAANPADREARANAENARELIRQLRQAQQQQQEQEQQQQQEQEPEQDQQQQGENQEQEQKQDQQQQQGQEQNQEQEQQQEQQQDQQASDRPQQDRNSQKQGGDGKEGQEPQEPSERQPSQDQPQQQQNQQQQQQQKDGDPDRSPPERNGEKQDQTSSRPSEGEGPPEEKPAGELDRAEGDAPPPDTKPQPAAGTPRVMTKDEAERLLQAVRDRERARRAALAEKAKAQRDRTPPARKDW